MYFIIVSSKHPSLELKKCKCTFCQVSKKHYPAPRGLSRKFILLQTLLVLLTHLRPALHLQTFFKTNSNRTEQSSSSFAQESWQFLPTTKCQTLWHAREREGKCYDRGRGTASASCLICDIQVSSKGKRWFAFLWEWQINGCAESRLPVPMTWVTFNKNTAKA